jgi:NifU-like protein
VSRYSPKVAELAAAAKHAGIDPDADGFGADADLSCGSVVRFSVRFDDDTGGISGVRFNSNGCSYMVASAEALCSRLSGQNVESLGGLGGEHLTGLLTAELGDITDDRRHCADRRERRAASTPAESTLICSCFGVSEAEIRGVIERIDADSVADVTAACNAGGGCGSCQMLIQDLIDTVIEHY